MVASDIAAAARDVASLQRLRGTILVVGLTLLPVGTALIQAGSLIGGAIVVALGLISAVVYVWLAPETYYFRLHDPR